MWFAFWRPPFLHRLCLVTTQSDPDAAFRGVIWQSRGAWLVLKNAAIVKAGAPPVPVDGEVVIHRSNLAFVQMDGAS